MKIECWPFRIDTTGFDFLVVFLYLDELGEEPFPICEIELGYYVFERR